MQTEGESDQVQSGPRLDFFTISNQSKSNQIVETVREVGDGIHANIYLANNLQFNKKIKK